MLAVRKCCWWLTSCLRINIDALNKAISNDLQPQWLSFHFSLMCLHFEAIPLIALSCENILCDLFVKIYHDFSTCIEIRVWLRTYSEVAPKDIDKKRQQHEPSQNTTTSKLIARCLECTVWDYTRYKWNGTKANKAFSNADSHTHTYAYNC